MIEYRKPGKYVAICNKGGFKGHYAVTFDFPAKVGDQDYEAHGIAASWYFLNRVDFQACIEAVYPIEVFESLFSKALVVIDDLRFAKYSTDCALAGWAGTNHPELSPRVEFKDLT